MKVKQYLRQINRRSYLPGLQREFVWDKDQIISLFESLILDYPVGVIIRWDLNQRAEEHSYHTYNLVDKYITDEGKIPDFLTEDYEYTRSIHIYEQAEPDFLIIDGQQRLTSLNIGFLGRITEYTAGQGGNREHQEDWTSYHLCINLLGHPDWSDEELTGNYEFQFRETGEFDPGLEEEKSIEAINRETKKLWLPLPVTIGDDREFKGQNVLRRMISEEAEKIEVQGEKDYELQHIWSAVLNDLQNSVLETDIPEIDIGGNSKEVKEIFQRLNMKGERPKPYQLLLSRMMTSWGLDDQNGFNPREKLNSWIEDFKDDYTEYEKEINQSFFLRYSCYLGDTQLKRSYIESLEEQDLNSVKQKWIGGPEEAPQVPDFAWFKRSLQRSLESLIEIGFDEETMDTMAMIASLGKFYYKNPNASENDQENLNSIFEFICQLLLFRHTKGSVGRVEARKLAEFLETQENDEYEVFPKENAVEAIEAKVAPDDMREIIVSAKYPNAGSGIFSNRDVPAILGISSKIYTSGNIANYEIDHIFPESRADEIEAQLDEEEFSIHRLGNLQLIPENLNNEKDNQMPEEWISGLNEARAREIKTKNNWPDKEPTVENYKEFVKEREEKIADKVLERVRKEEE